MPIIGWILMVFPNIKFKMKTVKTNNLQIWCGLKNTKTGEEKSLEFVEELLQEYVDEVGFCVSITKTKFIYTKGNENGVVVGIINYPRFPSSSSELLDHTTKIATILMEKLDQCRVTIVTPLNNIMLSNDKLLAFKD